MGTPSDAKFWLNFFTEAGIPRNTAMQYAITFSENRIDSNMLNDLTKEYLNEMNITVIGDVIAILKHAGEKAKADYFSRKTPANLGPGGGKLSSVVTKVNNQGAATNRTVMPPARTSQAPQAMQGVQGALANAQSYLPPDAGAYTMFIPPAARRKLAEAEQRRLAAASSERPPVSLMQHQQAPANQNPATPRVRFLRTVPASANARSEPAARGDLGYLRVVRSSNGLRRVVSDRPQPQPQPQPQTFDRSQADARAIRGAYMDDPRANGMSARLGKRRAAANANAHAHANAHAASGVNFNVVINPNSKKRRLSDGQTYDDVSSYWHDVAPRSARDRVLRTVVATGSGRTPSQRAPRALNNARDEQVQGRNGDLRSRLRGRRT